MAGGRIVITDDGRGMARGLESQLLAAGVAGRANRRARGAGRLDIAGGHRVGPRRVCGRAAPWRGSSTHFPSGSAVRAIRIETDWSARVGVEVKGLFLMAKAMAADLENAAQAGGACLIAATALGGRFASAGCGKPDFFPGHGGIAGLVKTLAREWPAVRSRVVDFSAADPIETVAGRLASEVFASDGWAEVGYDQDRRIRLRTVESPLEHAASTLELKPGEPVLISGGARGITALAAAELARLWRPTLLIVGTTPLPGDGESRRHAGLERRGRDQGRTARPAAPPGATRQSRPKSRRPTRPCAAPGRFARTWRACGRPARPSRMPRPTCATRGALARVLDGWRARHGEVVGLIHGAGLIKDKLIRHKSVESFDRVLETKLDGALNLIRLVRGDALKFTALFSSIAGRFGNVGQSDYAAANEILNKLAHWLDRRWPGRVVSLIWGPWSGVGMVSQLESHLGSRGLGMISPESGGSLLDRRAPPRP